MKLLIIEDEQPSAHHLMQLLSQIDNQIKVEGPLNSITSTLEYFANNPDPDLILMDIQLADGLSFEIFQTTTISTPVIFTTAYNQYALKAFELNSLDYLLKPVRLDRLKKALDKYKHLYKQSNLNTAMAENIMKMLQVALPKYKTRFLVRSGKKLVVVSSDQIVGFYKDEVSLLFTNYGKKYIIDASLDELMSQLEPNNFFRINRQCILNARYIQEMKAEGSQLRLTLAVKFPIKLSVSQRNVAPFKKWLNED